MTTRRSAAGSKHLDIRLDSEARQTMVLERQDAEAVYAALLQPPSINARLAAALKEHDRRVSPE